MTNPSETAWETSTGQLLPPQTVTLKSEATIYSGELTNVFGSQGPFLGAIIYFNNAFSSWLTTDLPLTILLNFDTPGLQPAGWSYSRQAPVPAPWTLTFTQPTASGSSWQAAGKLVLDAARNAPTTVNLTYVIQPQAAMMTLPATAVCPGTTSTCPAGAGGISNNLLSVTIPANQTQVQLAPLFEAEGQPYNVQVIAWQPQTTVNGEQIINPQAAYCITVPGQQP